MPGINSSNVDDPYAFNHRFAEVNGIRMHFVDEGKGPLVILLHGFPFLWYLWRHQIRALAAAGYRVVAPDQRGYGQTGQPSALIDYDITRVVGDVVGLMKALGEKSAVIVGQDWGSWIAYFSVVMRPDLFRGIAMMCAPPDAWTPVKPSVARARGKQYADLVFYREYFTRPTTPGEIMGDLRRWLTGTYYSMSGSCSAAERWRWVWHEDESYWDTFTVPKTRPAFQSQQALDYYVSEYARAGIQAPITWYTALESDWEARAFLDGVVARQPALFLYGEHDPSLMPLRGIDYSGPGFKSLETNFPSLKEVIKIPGAGHMPPEEKPEAVNEVLLKFLSTL
jgi:pimeloyl-ACP methyl ester carboxylesterase